MKEKEPLTRRGFLIRSAAVLAVVAGGLAQSRVKAETTNTGLNYKGYVPVVPSGFAEATPTPIPENPALKDTVLVEKLETILNGKSYTVESRISADALYQANIQPDLKQPLIDLVAKDGQRLGFNRAVILIVKIADQLPSGNQVTWTAVPSTETQSKWITIGKTGSQRLPPDNKILVYEFLPENDLPFSSQEFRDKLNNSTTGSFLGMTYGGGKFDSEHQVLANQKLIQVSQR